MHKWVGRCVLTAALSAATADPSAAQAAMNAKEKANLQFVLDWWREVIQSRHVELAPKYQAEDYIQHNINIQTGRDGFVKFFGSLGPAVSALGAAISAAFRARISCVRIPSSSCRSASP